MTHRIAILGLALLLAGPTIARADETAERVAFAKVLVDKSVLRSLDVGFAASLDKTVAALPADKGDTVRKEAGADFEKLRAEMSDELAKIYAAKFSLDELKYLQSVYENGTYQKFQALNSDPKSEINAASQAGIGKILQMLGQASARAQPPESGETKMNRPMQMPPQGK